MQKEQGIDSYLNLSEDARLFRLVFLCNSLEPSSPPSSAEYLARTRMRIVAR